MNPRATVDAREFNAAIRQLSGGVKSKAVQLANQIALDVSREWFNRLPPPIGQISAKRQEIREYLRTRIGVNTKRGKARRKGLEGTKRTPLMRLNLIVQARRARAGQRGLYGPAMKAAAGSFARRAQASVGSLKAMLLPVIRRLNPLVKYKMPFAETGGAGGGRISIWPGSRGYGKATPAVGKSPLAILNLAWNLKGPRAGYAQSLVLGGWRQATEFKLAKLKSRIEREMQGEFDRVNTRKAA
jgi:hypothetical protein